MIKIIICYAITKFINIFSLNESRLDNSVQDSEIRINHYKLIRKDRNRQGSRVAIYIHESLSYIQISNPIVDKLEVILLLIDIKKSKPLLFVNWYRPPNSKCEAISLYEDMLAWIEGYGASVIIMGDINLNILQEPLNAECKRYCQLNDIHDLHQINTSKYTRVSPESRSLIDHMLCNRPDNVIFWGEHDVGFSDHALSYLSWKVQRINNTNNHAKVISFRKSKGVDNDAYKVQDWSKVETCENIHSKNTRVSVTRKRVHWGQTPFRVIVDPEWSLAPMDPFPGHG